ncbi:hypothetical protein PDESU_03625 [Pontiella desulfatans]|uniref:Uncharacterized protein n=1 Tax=Pontiella desulfatans TaxID=2750659 RepID=A0A6C2U568_PONDE|nr:hypothetical protein PDESU_03625 [Pontiella desulfatans]
MGSGLVILLFNRASVCSSAGYSFCTGGFLNRCLCFSGFLLKCFLLTRNTGICAVCLLA